MSLWRSRESPEYGDEFLYDLARGVSEWEMAEVYRWSAYERAEVLRDVRDVVDVKRVELDEGWVWTVAEPVEAFMYDDEAV